MNGGSYAGAALLYLIDEAPALLEPAPLPRDLTGRMVIDRACAEIHLCQGCDRRAQVAVVVPTAAGPRWLDLCLPCRLWLGEQPGRQ
jgi:hypothetical protein